MRRCVRSVERGWGLEEISVTWHVIAVERGEAGVPMYEVACGSEVQGPAALEDREATCVGCLMAERPLASPSASFLF